MKTVKTNSQVDSYNGVPIGMEDTGRGEHANQYYVNLGGTFYYSEDIEQIQSYIDNYQLKGKIEGSRRFCKDPIE